MQKLWPIFIITLLLAFASDRSSVYQLGENGEKTYIKKEKVLYIIMTLLLAIFVGLRIWCNDTGVYRETYELLTSAEGPLLEGLDWSVGSNPAFVLSNRILKHLGISSQNFLMIFALVTNCIYLWFLRKYTSNIWLTIFLFITMGCYTFTMAAIKQTVAVAFGLIGIDRAVNSKWVGFVFWIVIATLFHPYALMFLITPFLFHKTWSKRTYIIIAFFFILGIGMPVFLNLLVSVTSMLGETFDNSEFMGAGVNVFRLAVIWAPVLLSFTVRKQIQADNDRIGNLFLNCSIINASIMFVALFGTANYFARLANYFLIFQTLSVPWMMKYFNKISYKVVYLIVVVCYLLYFLYTNIVYQPFDSYFARMSFIEYLKTCF